MPNLPLTFTVQGADIEVPNFWIFAIVRSIFNHIFDSCIEMFEFGDNFGLRSKFIGVPRKFYNGNYGENSKKLRKLQTINATLIYIINCITCFSLEIIVVIPRTWSPDIGFGRNPKGTFPKYHASIPFDNTESMIFNPEVNKYHIINYRVPPLV